jgi:sugar lactone lactonase YvrE
MAKLYVSSANENNIIAYDATTGARTLFVQGAVTSNLQSPQGLVWGPDGKLYVSSASTNNVLRFNADGSFDTTFATGNGLNTPEGLTFDSSGNLYVSNYIPNQNGNVLRWLSNGTFDKIFAADASLTIPWGLIFGADGELYVCNNDAQRPKVLRFTATGAFNGVYASQNLFSAASLAFDSDGRLYVTDRINNVVVRYLQNTGAFSDLFATAGALTKPNGIVFGSDGNLYVTCSQSPVQGSTAPYPNSSVLRYLGPSAASPGTFDKVFASGAGLDNPTWLTFGP